MTKNKELVQDVRDLLNQLAIKLKNVKNYNAQFNDHGYPIYNEEKGEDRDEDDECADSRGDCFNPYSALVSLKQLYPDGKSMPSGGLIYTSSCRSAFRNAVSTSI